MEVTECTNIVLEKIQKIEPEIATKIFGYLLLSKTHQEIMEYAFGSEKLIYSLINEAKAYLAASSPKPAAPIPIQPDQSPIQHAVSRPFSSPSSFRVPAPYMSLPHSSADFLPASYNNDFPRVLHNGAELAAFDDNLHSINPVSLDLPSNYFYSDGHFGGGLGPRGSLRSPPNGLPEFTNKPCHYFYKGYCRHGNYCKFFHGQPVEDDFSQMYGLYPNELINDDHLFSTASLAQLEVEISELLKARKGMPVSIASLPSLYLELYGKALQADGYLTESQRNGKAGFSLTKLLARLNNIRLIDRPHGQHAVVLAEDAAKYEYKNERNDSGAALPSSHQIYLTFPAESSFTDEDVFDYFKLYGPVRDVRIPRQEKRMFGFVSFFSPETVKNILAKGHPHHIRGSRVLVKPYKEKTRICDRKFPDRSEFSMFYPPQYYEMDPDFPTMPRLYENSSFLKKQMMREQEHAIELESRRLLGLQLNTKDLAPNSYFNYQMDELKSPADHFSYLPAQDNGSSSDDKPQQTGNNTGDKDSGHIELPDSPFASPRVGNGIYTAV